MEPLVYEEPVLYLKVTEATGIISTMINVVALLLIYFASPKKMGEYRYFLLAYQVVTSVGELLLKISMIEIFQPAPAARFHFTAILIDAKFWDVTAAFFTTSLSTTTAFCLFYRHRQVLPLGHWARWKPSHLVIFFVANYVFYTGLFAYSLSFALMEKGQSTLLLNWITAHPEHARLWIIPDVWIADFEVVVPFFGLFIGELFGVLVLMLLLESIVVCSFLYSHAFFMLRRTAGTMSEKTRQLHRRLLILLGVQMGVPMLTIVGPFVAIAVALGSKVQISQLSNHLFIFAVGSHGMVSSFSIVLLTDSYRQCLTGIFGGRKSSVVIGVVVEKASLSLNKTRSSKAKSLNAGLRRACPLHAHHGGYWDIVNPRESRDVILDLLRDTEENGSKFLLAYQLTSSCLELFFKLSMVEPFQPAPVVRFQTSIFPIGARVT
ncbi:unnamed protein product, partial [Mesorhabditis spiculigera]